MMQRFASPFSARLFPALIAIGLLGAGCSPEPDASADAGDPAPAEMSFAKDVSVSEAKALLAGENAPTVLDVRTLQEFEAGHIEGAVNVDFLSDDFAEALAKLDKSQPYVLHCKSGGRSTKALDEMEAQGFEDVAHMTGGYDAWKAEAAGE